MNNVGVAGWKPLISWCSEVWLFFDQVFLRGLQAPLSTFLLARISRQNPVDKPVDKSVTKLWKDPAESRACWLAAIARFDVPMNEWLRATQQADKGQAKKFANPPQSPVDCGLQLIPLAPRDCGPACG